MQRALEVPTPESWFWTRIAMIAGFITSYLVNWRLLRRGIKGKMLR